MFSRFYTIILALSRVPVGKKGRTSVKEPTKSLSRGINAQHVKELFRRARGKQQLKMTNLGSA